MENIDFTGAKRLMDSGARYVLIDVRDEEEYITGHAAGALLLPVDEISAATAAAAVPDKTTAILTYCRTGRRSFDAAKKLEALGYTAVYNLGSLVEWPYRLEYGL